MEIYYLDEFTNNKNFVSENVFDEYLEIAEYGDNSYHKGIKYGPYTSTDFYLSNNPNVKISFFMNFDNDIVAKILSSLYLR